MARPLELFIETFRAGALALCRTDAQQGTILLSPMLKEGPTNSLD